MVGRSHPESLLSPVSPVPSVPGLYERSGQKPTYRTLPTHAGHCSGSKIAAMRE